MAFIGRMGAFIEAISVVAFGWAYGEMTFGLFAVLWSYIKVMTAITDSAMTTGLQRFVPKASRSDANLMAGFALKFSFLLGVIFASLMAFFADTLAGYINASDADKVHLATIIKLYAWTLPFWTVVEVSTASIRAKRTFGPEIKVRIFYEQGIRLVAGLSFAAIGFMSYGLFLAHLLSVIIAAILGLRLISKHYDFSEVISAPLISAINSELLSYGLSVMPANVIKKLFSELPVMMLNQLLPGAAGAAASGYYAIARKLASVLQVIRLTFEYVMAPLAAESHGKGDRLALVSMYQFSTRLSVCFALPLCMALLIARQDILAIMKPEFIAASGAIAILCLGRAIESASGPSSAIIEMLGHRLLPIFNGLCGMAVLCILSYYLVDDYGVTGAALAATAGINTTAWLSLLQSLIVYKLNPYSHALIKPLALSLVISLGIGYGLSGHYITLSPPMNFVAALVSLLLALLVIIRYGLDSSDAKALGKMGIKLNVKT